MATRMGSERKRKGKALTLIDSSVGSRKPLSDCSNILAPRKSSSSSTSKPTPNHELSTPYRTQQVKNSSTIASNPRTHPATPDSVPRTPSRVSGWSECAAFEPRSVYTRKRTAEKRNDMDKHRDKDKPAVAVKPVFKRPRHDRSGGRVAAVIKESRQDLEEYVSQQKSYFEEVDAFELLVEEASNEELE